MRDPSDWKGEPTEAREKTRSKNHLRALEYCMGEAGMESGFIDGWVGKTLSGSSATWSAV